MNIMPAIFVNQCGGPIPLLVDPTHANLVKYLLASAKVIPFPRAILVASAHWETPVTTFIGPDDSGLLYDYYGFTSLQT